MSGPVRDVDLADGVEDGDGLLDHVEVREGRRADVGGLDVVRVLPTKGRRTVGAWCFVDLLGPVDMADPDPLEIGPHPHIGLSTVTWLLEGEALHTDSLGTEQVIRAGQLNLMTAGHGISHAELAAHPPFQGAQLWIAQPEATRHGAPAFEHHAELPHVEIVGSGGAAEATLLVGGIGDRRSDASAASDATDARSVRSPARADTPLVGADVLLAPGATTVPLDPGFEHAVAPIDAPVLVGGHVVEPGSLALVPAGVDELVLTARDRGARILLLGGEPLESPVVMWWNFVARDRDEITDAWRSWNARDERFGTVASPLDRIEAPAPPWIRA